MGHHLGLLDLVEDVRVEFLIVFVQFGYDRVLLYMWLVVLGPAVEVMRYVFLIALTTRIFTRPALRLPCLSLTSLVLRQPPLMTQPERLWHRDPVFLLSLADLRKLG